MSLLPIVSCYVSSFFSFFLFNVFVGAVWCVCHPYFSWSLIFLAILLILPPLSPLNGALCCGTSHLSLCIITARHGNFTMSQIHCRWSNLYYFMPWITIYIFVRHCMAPHTFLCVLLLHVTEILLWVRYIVYIQIYIEIHHGNHLYCCTSLYDVLCVTDNILYCCTSLYNVSCIWWQYSLLRVISFTTFLFLWMWWTSLHLDVWHALHSFLSCPWRRLAHFILSHRIQATNE